MSQTITGLLHAFGPTIQVSEKFRKRDFVLNTEGDYPQYIQFQLTQDKVNEIEKFAKGQAMTVHFNLRGREYVKNGENKYFNTLEAWKLDRA